MRETWVRSLGWEYPLEECMANPLQRSISRKNHQRNWKFRVDINRIKIIAIGKVCACVLWCSSHVWLCNPKDYSPPDSCEHGILQAKILKRVALPSSGVSSPLKVWTCISCIVGGLFIAEPWGNPGIRVYFINAMSEYHWWKVQKGEVEVLVA